MTPQNISVSKHFLRYQWVVVLLGGVGQTVLLLVTLAFCGRGEPLRADMSAVFLAQSQQVECKWNCRRNTIPKIYMCLHVHDIIILHTQLIFQLQSFPYTLIYLRKDPSVLDDHRIRSLMLSISVTLYIATRHVYISRVYISRGRCLRLSSAL